MTSRHYNSTDLNPAIAMADRITRLLDREQLNAYQLINVMAMISASMIYNTTSEPRQREQLIRTIADTTTLHLHTIVEGASHGKDS